MNIRMPLQWLDSHKRHHAPSLCLQDRLKLLDLYNTLDADGTNALKGVQMQQALRVAGYDEHAEAIARAMFGSIGKTMANDTISPQEFVYLLTVTNKPDTPRTGAGGSGGGSRGNDSGGSGRGGAVKRLVAKTKSGVGAGTGGYRPQPTTTTSSMRAPSAPPRSAHASAPPVLFRIPTHVPAAMAEDAETLTQVGASASVPVHAGAGGAGNGVPISGATGMPISASTKDGRRAAVKTKTKIVPYVYEPSRHMSLATDMMNRQESLISYALTVQEESRVQAMKDFAVRWHDRFSPGD